MNIIVLLIAAFVALGYTAWPNLAKPLGVSPGLVAVIVVFVALIVVIGLSFRDLGSMTSLSGKALFWIIGISIFNALAIYLQSKTAASPQVQTGMFLAAIFILQVIAAPLIDWVVNGETLSKFQWAGLGLSIPTLLLLSKG